MLSDSARLLRQQMSYPEEYWQVLMQSLENWQASGIAFDRFEWHQEIYPLAYTAIGQSFNNRDAAQFPTYAESLTQALIQILKKLKSVSRRYGSVKDANQHYRIKAKIQSALYYLGRINKPMTASGTTVYISSTPNGSYRIGLSLRPLQ